MSLRFVTIRPASGSAVTCGPFLTRRSLRSWLNEHEERSLGSDGVVLGRWRSRRRVS